MQQQHQAVVSSATEMSTRPVVSITASQAATVAALAVVEMDRGRAAAAKQAEKTEINAAVAKVLEGYDWTLVPIATKWVLNHPYTQPFISPA